MAPFKCHTFVLLPFWIFPARKRCKGEETKKSLRSKQKGISTPAGLDLLTRSFRDLCTGIVLDGDVSTSHCSRCCFSSSPSPGAPKQSDNRGSQSSFSPHSRHEAEASAPGSRTRSRRRRGSCQQSSAPTWYHYIMFEPWPSDTLHL